MFDQSDVIELSILLTTNGINFWVDGGWGVDALLSKQTRLHLDIDIVIQQKDVSLIRKLLESQEYRDVERDDTSPWNFVLGDNTGREVDIHAVVFDSQGNGLYGPPEKGVIYPAKALTGKGKIGEKSVPCVAAEYLVKFHTGYKLDENDFKDVSALCNQFGIDLPEEYFPFSK